MALKQNDINHVSQLIYLATLARNYAADIASTCAQFVANRELSANKTTTITSASTDEQYPSAAAVYTLFQSITNANEVSY